MSDFTKLLPCSALTEHLQASFHCLQKNHAPFHTEGNQQAADLEGDLQTNISVQLTGKQPVKCF